MDHREYCRLGLSQAQDAQAAAWAAWLAAKAAVRAARAAEIRAARELQRWYAAAAACGLDL